MFASDVIMGAFCCFMLPPAASLTSRLAEWRTGGLAIDKRTALSSFHLPKQNAKCVGDQHRQAYQQREAVRVLSLLNLIVLRHIRYHAADNHCGRGCPVDHMPNVQIQFVIYNPIHDDRVFTFSRISIYHNFRPSRGFLSLVSFHLLFPLTAPRFPRKNCQTIPIRGYSIFRAARTRATATELRLTESVINEYSWRQITSDSWQDGIHTANSNEESAKVDNSSDEETPTIVGKQRSASFRLDQKRIAGKCYGNVVCCNYVAMKKWICLLAHYALSF